jgi:ubiquinone/menaquinone biosynthesis C-methylase UbiE
VARSRDTLTAARYAFTTLARELDADFAGSLTGHPSLTTGWVHADWTQALPFKSNALHRIVCNLSLPFVPSPLAALRELLRILHPQGRLVLTAFHHDTDLAVLYRRHLQQANQDEFTAQSQTILHYLGRLREAMRHGLLHTFDRTSLARLLRQSGIAPARIITTLDGQALVAVVEKGNSAS